MSPQHRRISRLYLDRDLAAARIALTEREAHYLGTVLRLERGARVLVFNGRGQERYASIRSLARRGAELEMLEASAPVPEPELRLTLLQALPKAEAMDLVVQKATELGVRAIVPVATDFSVVRLSGTRAERRIEHWSRIAQSACEQSGRHRPTEIRPVVSLEACLDALPGSAAKLWLDTRSEAPFAPAAAPSAEVFLLVGPEGGFSAADAGLVEAHGFKALRLGPRTLRTETASIAACALLQHLWGDLR
ncbi:MAG TPA: 16S rRNA (uracil(1498)-N(3))-methyltransferase [Gammaproteobacteria bacterium]|nr:16S rRNA (uracil(1498)-N(3))-methyltransferase [Gammaproteobacteria bacterium]